LQFHVFVSLRAFVVKKNFLAGYSIDGFYNVYRRVRKNFGGTLSNSGKSESRKKEWKQIVF